MQNARLNSENSRDAPVSRASAVIASSPRLAITAAALRKISRRSNAPIVDQAGNAAWAASAARGISAGGPCGDLTVPRRDVISELAGTRGYICPADQQAALDEVAATRSFGHHRLHRHLDVGAPGLRHDNL